MTILACNSDLLDTLPPKTQEGNGTFGCEINGIVWLPNKGAWFDQNPTAIVLDTSFSITATKDNETVQLYVNGSALKNEIIELGGKNIKHGLFIENKKYYYTGKDNSGELLITNLDSLSGILSGTFWFDAVNSDGEKVEVRDGRFDLIYNSN